MNEDDKTMLLKLISKYCKCEIAKGNCSVDGECEYCSVNNFYDRVRDYEMIED